MWGFDGDRINLRELRPFKLGYFGSFFCDIGYNQLLLQFIKEDMYMAFLIQVKLILTITAI